MSTNKTKIKPTANNTTLFAGAGFSRAVSEKVKYCGNEELKMPLACEMFKSSVDYLEGIKFPGHKYSELGCYLCQKRKCFAPEINYEEVYGDLEGKHKILAEALEMMVFENLGVNYPPIRVRCEAEQTINIIREFLEGENISNIVTTNPDILLDVAIMGATEFDKKFIELFGGFSKKVHLIEDKCKHWQPVLRKNNSFNPLESIKRFIKIHGSITMVVPKEIKQTSEEFYWWSKYKWNKGISSVMFIHDKEYKHCVIPPSPSKGERYEQEPWNGLIAEAKDILDHTKKLIFYGFGFSKTDNCLAKIMKDSIAKIEDIKIIDTKSDSSKFQKQVACFLGVDLSKLKFESPQV